MRYTIKTNGGGYVATVRDKAEAERQIERCDKRKPHEGPHYFEIEGAANNMDCGSVSLVRRLVAELRNQLELAYDKDFDGNAMALIEEGDRWLANTESESHADGRGMRLTDHTRLWEPQSDFEREMDRREGEFFEQAKIEYPKGDCNDWAAWARRRVFEWLRTMECRSVAGVLRAAHDVHDRLCYLRCKCRDSSAVALEANELAIKVSDGIIQPLEAMEQESVTHGPGPCPATQPGDSYTDQRDMVTCTVCRGATEEESNG